MTNPIPILVPALVNGLDIRLGRMLSRYQLGSWYIQGQTTTAINMTNNRAWAVPFALPREGTLSGVGLVINTAFATTAGNIRAGLFTDTGAMLPGARTVADFGTVAATAGTKTWTVSVPLTPNVYWVVFAIQGAAGTAGTWTPSASSSMLVGDSAATPTFTTAWNGYFTDTGFTGAFPSSFGTPAGAGQGPRTAIRFSA